MCNCPADEAKPVKQKNNRNMTAIAIPAQFAHPSVNSVMNMDAAVAGNRLDRICNGESVAQVYRDESRPWWDLVDEDKVYDIIRQEEHQAYVRLITALA